MDDQISQQLANLMQRGETMAQPAQWIEFDAIQAEIWDLYLDLDEPERRRYPTLDLVLYLDMLDPRETRFAGMDLSSLIAEYRTSLLEDLAVSSPTF